MENDKNYGKRKRSLPARLFAGISRLKLYAAITILLLAVIAAA